MKRLFAGLTLAALSFAPIAVHASPIAFQQNTSYPAFMWHTLDKVKAQVALEAQNAGKDDGK